MGPKGQRRLGGAVDGVALEWHVFFIGKPALKYAGEGVSEYRRRIEKFRSLELLPIKKAPRERESETLLNKSQGMYRIALDERGQAITTVKLAEKLKKLEVAGKRKVAFLIGGADGHTEKVREESDLVLSLSSLTLQHELALVVLLEQIYRMETIWARLPYHRE